MILKKNSTHKKYILGVLYITYYIKFEIICYSFLEKQISKHYINVMKKTENTNKQINKINGEIISETEEKLQKTRRYKIF